MSKLSVEKALLKAKFYEKKGLTADAYSLYKSILQVFPENKKAQKGLADLRNGQLSTFVSVPPQSTVIQLVNLYNRGQFVAVVQEAQVLTKQYPRASMLWNILGAANNGLGRIDDASESFKMVTKLNPKYADGFNNLGVTLQKKGNFSWEGENGAFSAS